MSSLWGELKRRNVVRVAVAYAVVSWLILQLADVLIPLFTVPEWVGRLVFLLLLIGLPLVLFVAWAFELTPEGVKKEKDVDRTQSVTHSTGRKLDFAIIAALTMALAFFVADKYFLTPDVAPPTAAGSEIVATEVQQSIAVLPFVNMSSDPEQEFFSDGLSEELLNLLAKIPELKVIARTSSFAFKGKNEDLRVIGKLLDVRTVLEGSVRKSGNRIRITAQLIDVSDGAHIWSETYDRTMTDVFEIQDSVAAEILAALQVHVGVMPERGRPTTDGDAYTKFLKAREYLNNWGLFDAISLLEGVVEQDPSFAEAYELLAYAYWLSGGTAMKSVEAQRLTEAASRKALALDPDLILAQSLFDSSDSQDYSFLREIESLERTAVLRPGDVASFDMLAFDLMEAGYLQEALGYAERFVKLDPLAPAAHLRMFQALYAVGRLDEALDSLATGREFGGDYHQISGTVHWLAVGEDAKAITYFEEWMDLYGLPTRLAREFIVGARDPVTGQDFLDAQIPKIVAQTSVDLQFDVQRQLHTMYLPFGYVDRMIELILEVDTSESTWTEADDMIFGAHLTRAEGFTTHPRYIEVARHMDLIELWEQRGPPDFCKKTDDEWICE